MKFIKMIKFVNIKKIKNNSKIHFKYFVNKINNLFYYIKIYKF